jgi:hypothetical protein
MRRQASAGDTTTRLPHPAVRYNDRHTRRLVWAVSDVRRCYDQPLLRVLKECRRTIAEREVDN